MGPMRVLVSGRDVVLAARKARALLAYLALRPNQTVPRETLIGMFWGDYREKQARANLRQTLSTLRRNLGEAANTALITSHEDLCLASTQVWVDVKALEDCDSSRTADDLVPALALYRGELLEGLSLGEPAFEQWLNAERARLRALLSRMLARQVDLLEKERRLEEAIEQASRLVALDPLQEDVHRNLMRLYQRQGRYDAALSQYEQCRKELAQQLSVDPAIVTRDLAADIRKLRRQVATGGPEPSSRTLRKTAAEQQLPDKPSVAVLPFANLSGNKEQEYFSDGITEDIITELGRFNTLFVIARHSTFAYRGESVDVAQVGQQLGVRYVVEGSVRRAGSRVRVNAQLAETVSGQQVWAQRYDRDLIDIFAVQDEVTRLIVGTIVGRIDVAEEERVGRKSPEDISAYDCYLRGLQAFNRSIVQPPAIGSEGLRQAKTLFKEAIEIDPTYARAHTYLAFIGLIQFFFTYAERDALEDALPTARKAIALDPNDSFAPGVMGLILIFLGREEEGFSELEFAFENNRNDAELLHWAGFVSAFAGRPEDGIAHITEAIRLNPFNTYYYFALGLARLNAREFAEAAATLRKVVRAEWEWAQCGLAAAYGHLGRHEEARSLAQQFVANVSGAAVRRGETGSESAIFLYERAFRGRLPRSDWIDIIVEGLRKAGVE